MSRPGMVWTADQIALLTTLWRNGVLADEIARQLLISKNAVIGKAHRIGLPPRQPIRSVRSVPSKVRPSRAKASPPEPRQRGTGVVVGPTLPGVSAAAVAQAHRPALDPVRVCCWPMWKSGARPNGHFCGSKAVVGRPYCPEHASLAYVPVRPREVTAYA